MGFPVPVIVYLPKGYSGGEAYPVWYALHGYSSSETMWVDDEHIDQIADQLIADREIPPLVMVFPFVRYDSAKVIAADMQDGIRSESQSARFLCEELIPYIDTTFVTIPASGSRSIGGFSMNTPKFIENVYAGMGSIACRFGCVFPCIPSGKSRKPTLLLFSSIQYWAQISLKTYSDNKVAI